MSIEIIKSNPIYRKAYKWISENSTSNTLPYHNMNHLMSVFTACYNASDYYRIKDTDGASGEITLCLAALFHDANHSGGKLTDDKNIKNAISSFCEFTGAIKSDYLSMFDVDKVIETIKATQYPYEITDINELTLYQRIIRDADLTSAFSGSDWIQAVVFGLKEEIGVSTVEERINQQVKFILTTELCTDWGRAILEDCKGRLLNELANIKSILKGDDLFIEDDGETITIVNDNNTTTTE